MTPSETLTAQAAQLLEHVQQQRSRLAIMLEAIGGGSQKEGFARITLRKLREQLDSQSGRLKELIAEVSNGGDLAEERKNFRRIDQICRDLFGECLAVSISAAVRRLELDHGACAIVEKLLSQLGDHLEVQWPYVTTLADSEFFATASEVIRVRFPAFTVWDFPVAAHEFGHFIGRRLRSSNDDPTPYQSFLQVQDMGSRDCLEEYFADMIAVLTMGPAYLHSCLIHRFDPAGEEGKNHPADGKRAFWILAGLEYIAGKCEAPTRGLLDMVLQSRTEEWKAAVSSNGGLPLTPETEKTLRRRARDLCKKLYFAFPDAALTDLQAALQLFADFAENVEPKRSHEIRQIVNAAWMIRLHHERKLNEAEGMSKGGPTVGEIDQWARQACLRAIQ
jgi:hypothetical protein